jgi:hypothetical protein
MECSMLRESVSVADLSRGNYDGHLNEESRKLTHEQLEAVAALLTKYVKRGEDNTGERAQNHRDLLSDLLSEAARNHPATRVPIESSPAASFYF